MNHNNHGAFSAGVLLKTHHGWDFGLARLWKALRGKRVGTQVPAYEPERRSDPPIGIGSDVPYDASSTRVLAEARRHALQSGFYS